MRALEQAEPDELYNFAAQSFVDKSWDLPALTVQVTGATVQERLLKLIALGDFASVYLGMLYRVDPTPVVRVEALKRFMKKGD